MDIAPYFLISPIIAGVIGLIIAVILYFRVKAQPSGNETMNRIAGYIREGSMAFLVREYKVLAVYCVVVGAVLFYALGMTSAIWFILGAFLSLFAGFVGMKAATFANVRTTQAAATSTKGNALLVALDGGAVMGLCVAGLGLIGLGALYYFYQGAKELGTIHIHLRSGLHRLLYLRGSVEVFIPRLRTWALISPAKWWKIFPKMILVIQA